MILECGHCGAPLDVKEGATTTRCRYCRTVNERQRMRTIAAETPRDFRPPKVWVPPPHVQLRADKPLKYQTNTAVNVVIALASLLGLVVGIGAVVASVVAKSRGKSPASLLSDVTPQTLASLRIDQTAEGLGKALSANVSKTSIYKPLSDSRFEYLTFSWDEAHPEHPNGFSLGANHNAAADPKIAAALSKRLHGGFDDGNWHWAAGMNVNVQKNGSINVHVEPEGHGPKKKANVRWKQMVGAAWKIVLEAAFGFPAAISPRDAQEMLGAPHPFGDLLKLDPKTPIDDAEKTVSARFPGAVVGTFISLDAEINVDHPLVREVRLSWENKRGGQMTGIGFTGSAAYLGRRDAFVSCLGGKLGAPRENDTDYVNKKKDFSFQVGRAWFSVNEKTMHLSGGGGDSIASESHMKVLSAIDACR